MLIGEFEIIDFQGFVSCYYSLNFILAIYLHILR